MLFSNKNDFCKNLSWIIFNVSGDGLISAFFSTDFKTSLSPDSISYVMISDFSDNSMIASLSLKSATICSAPTNDAEQPGFGSNTIIFDL